MVLTEKSIIRIVAAGPLLFIPLIIFITLLLTIKIYNDTLQQAITTLEDDLITLEKRTIQIKVDGFADLITYRKSIVEDDLTARIKQRVENARQTAETIYEHYKETKSAQEIKNIIKTTLRPSQWNNGESYIWIIDHNGVLQLGPENITHLEGHSIIDFKDATGLEVIKKEIAICMKNGEGYLWDTFTKSGEGLNKQFQQIAYVKDFGHYDWYFGTAEFLGTAARKMDGELLKSISKIDHSINNSIFIVNNSGTVLLNNRVPERVGKNIYDNNDSETIETFHKTIDLLANQDSAYLTYSWENPKTQQTETKYTYVRTIDNSDWIIGNGFYESDIKEMVAKQTIAIYEVYYSKFKFLIFFSLFFLIIGLVVSYLLSQYLKHNFRRYQNKINKTTEELRKLNEGLEEKVQERTKELETMADELKILATTDSLTKVNNRYAIMNILATEINRSRRYNEPLSVLMFDADHFKEINDNYGHDVGDVVLFDLAKTVQKSLREIDIIGRYGGEEFLVLMPNTAIDDAQIRGERVRSAVEKHCFETVGTVAISLGLVQCNSDEDVDGLFRRLDQLMYRAKDAGRNQLYTGLKL